MNDLVVQGTSTQRLLSTAVLPDCCSHQGVERHAADALSQVGQAQRAAGRVQNAAINRGLQSFCPEAGLGLCEGVNSCAASVSTQLTQCLDEDYSALAVRAFPWSHPARINCGRICSLLDWKSQHLKFGYRSGYFPPQMHCQTHSERRLLLSVK